MYLPNRTILNNRYEVEAVLGHGGFGITYAAYDQSFGARVAIKEYLPRHLATRGEGKARVSVYSGEARRHFDYGLKKFMEEAQLLAQFAHHPNVVSARDYFEANGTAYMVMEYAEGVTLKEYLEKKGGRISFEEARGIMMPVMDALREVHQVGLLHRDISPDNIYITTAAQVRVIDFGAARYFAGEQSKSLSVILKSGYAPEEQYRSSGKQGPWTDVYAVGATLYKLITGQTPPDALDRMAGDTLEPPSRLGVAIPPAAEQALLQALAVNAGQRFQNMGEFQQALTGGESMTMGFQPAAAPFKPSPGPVYNPVSAPPQPPVFAQPSPPPSRYPQLPRRSANPAAIAAGIGIGIIGLILVVVLIIKVIPLLTSDITIVKNANHAGEQEERDPQTQAEKLFKEGEALIKQGKFKEAIAKMDEILRLNPNHALAHFGRGAAYFNMGNYQLAIEPLKQTIKLTHEYPNAYAMLGLTYNKLHRYSEAIPIWEQVLKVQPNFPDAHYELGYSYLETGNREKAMGQYDILQKMQKAAGSNNFVQKMCKEKAEVLLASINRKYPTSPEDLRPEIEMITERIRTAHLNKDINKWLGCYHSSYPNLGRLENRQLELWRNYDIKEVNYRISNVQRVNEKQAAADIVWNIQLYDHRTHDYTLVRQAYQTIFKLSSSRWQIADSKEMISENKPVDQPQGEALMSMDAFTPIVQGYDSIREGKYEAAKNLFAIAVQRDHNNPFALNNLAVLKEREGKLNDALVFFKDCSKNANNYLDKVTQTCFAGGGSLAVKPLREKGDRSSIAPIIRENINKIEPKIKQEHAEYMETLRRIEEREQKGNQIAFAEPSNKIPYLGSNVDGPLKLFNGGTGPIPEKNERVYMNRFQRSDNVFIAWELNLISHNTNIERKYFIKTVMNRMDGSEFIKDNTYYDIKNGWNSCNFALRINKATSQYNEGHYIMNLYCEDIKIASDRFEVY